MLYTIDEIRNRLYPIFEEQGVLRAILFGSYAKGEATDKSDIDIAAFVDKEMSIINFCAIADKVINELGKNVDFLYADDIIPGGRVDLALKEDGVLLYAKD